MCARMRRVTSPLEVASRSTSVVAGVDEVVVGQDGRVGVANYQHGPTAEILQGFKGDFVSLQPIIKFGLVMENQVSSPP